MWWWIAGGIAVVLVVGAGVRLVRWLNSQEQKRIGKCRADSLSRAIQVVRKFEPLQKGMEAMKAAIVAQKPDRFTERLEEVLRLYSEEIAWFKENAPLLLPRDPLTWSDEVAGRIAEIRMKSGPLVEWYREMEKVYDDLILDDRDILLLRRMEEIARRHCRICSREPETL